MVDALRRAHAMLAPGGRVLDLHPTAVASSLLVGDVVTGHIDAGDAPLRHAAAGAALAAVVADGIFVVERGLDITFDTYADTVDELRDYVADNWRNASIGDESMARTQEALRSSAASAR